MVMVTIRCDVMNTLRHRVLTATFLLIVIFILTQTTQPRDMSLNINLYLSPLNNLRKN